MEENGVLENYDMEDLYFKDYPQPGLMQVAIWVKRREFMKRYPRCEIETVPFKCFVRVIAHEPEVKDSFTLYRKGCTRKTFQHCVFEFEQFFKEKYPDCEISKEYTELGIRIVARKKGTL